MPGAVRLAAIRASALSVDEVLTAAQDPTVGGIAMFVGTVRCYDGPNGPDGHNSGATVASLEYDAHPDAVEVLQRIAAEVAAQPDVVTVAAVHRVGLLEIGDLAVVAAVGCAHRGDAFVAGRRLIDDIKEHVPIWKRQTFADGGVEWVGIEQ